MNDPFSFQAKVLYDISAHFLLAHNNRINAVAMDSYTYERPYHDERAAKRDKQQCRLLVIAAIMLIAGACVARSVYEERASNAVDNRSRMFAFKIGNLDGNETESGTVFIQTRPDWAPLGAERFHVSNMAIF
jgi:hypothetical protein